MNKTTDYMVRAAAGIVMAWFGWQLVSMTVLQMVNLSLQSRQLQTELAACQGKGGAPAH